MTLKWKCSVDSVINSGREKKQWWKKVAGIVCMRNDLSRRILKCRQEATDRPYNHILLILQLKAVNEVSAPRNSGA